MVGAEEEDYRVADYWQPGVGWRWQELHQKLSLSNTVLLASTMLSPDSGTEDALGWLKAGARDFTVKRAYELAMCRVSMAPWPGWKLLWKVEATQRVKVFTRTLSHDKLLTNKER